MQIQLNRFCHGNTVVIVAAHYRNIEFLLLQNRLNVAVSRAEHTAYVVYSTGLLDDLPRTPEGAARLSAFARLVGAV